ncbi:uncharacterized protein DMAD_03057 [Drosophila madeirensis]|uniref:Uncharacterized protein n=1 Tax=Drosophila madeirensis TaxID=30013 RepID=A0AAU9G8V8_DROMD
MPVLEHIDDMASTPAPATTTVTTDTEAPHQAAPELTQTDHLNRRLLKSLLDTMQMQMQSDDANQSNDDSNNDESNNEFDE